MSKNPLKGKVPQSSLIALGMKNKAPRPVPSVPSNIKRPKYDDLNPASFISSFEQAVKQDSGGSEIQIINFLNSIKSSLITNRMGKINPSHCLALVLICKKLPQLFTKSSIVDCLCSILSFTGKESSIAGAYKSQLSTNNCQSVAKVKQFHILVCSILLNSFKESSKWPYQFVKVYLDDSSGERLWVDLPECSLFVQNIETAFPTPGIDPKTLYSCSPISEPISNIINLSESGVEVDPGTHPDMEASNCYNKIIYALNADELVKPRFEHCKQQIDAIVNSWIKDFNDKRYLPDGQSRPYMRTFCALAGLPEVRGAVVSRLDTWLQSNPKNDTKDNNPHKLQNVCLNMLSIMANSTSFCFNQNSCDYNLVVHLMLKMKYKLLKPQIQTSLLECIRKITETHPNNLRSMLVLYVHSELYGSPTLSSSTSLINSTSVNKLTAAQITFPAVYFRFPSECIKILGDNLHEQICQSSDLKPIRIFIRDLCRWIKLAHVNTNNVYHTFGHNGTLPDSLDLLELAQSLLSDRSSTETFIGKITDPNFKKSYVENMINIITDLQMLSIIRPTVKEVLKEKFEVERNSDSDALRQHYANLRQIRHITCKWIKNIFKHVESAVTPEQMVSYMKQVMFLNVIRNRDFSYTADESYSMNEIWSGDSDKSLLIKGLTEIPLSDKLITTVIGMGFDKSITFRPVDIVEILSELIIRASASASADIIPMNVSKGETMINNMFACCSYDGALDEKDPRTQMCKTLAYKSSFWLVCQALVVVASHCPDTCGAYLWSNYPSVKNLMQLVITNNFDSLNSDPETLENELKLSETDVKEVIKVENMLIDANSDITSSVDANNSKLANLLMLNLPLGPTRQPPSAVLESLKSINQVIKIGDRLSQSRDPDFLLEIVKSQDQRKVSSRKWIIDLVKKTSENNMNRLPLLCLTEFIYHELYENISNLTHRLSSDDVCLEKLVYKIRDLIRSKNVEHMGDEVTLRIVGSLSTSFFTRLSDASAFTRKVARESLYILMQPINSSVTLMSNMDQFKNTLKAIVDLDILKSNVHICSVTNSLREILNFETDIEFLQCYIEFFALMLSSNHKDWLSNIVDTISLLLLNRPIIAEKLKANDHNNVSNDKQSLLTCESLAEIYLAYIDYVAYHAEAVPLTQGDKAVMVSWNDRKFPMTIRVIQSQLLLLCWGIVESDPIQKLMNIWFKELDKNNYQLPEFTSLSTEIDLNSVIPQWLINSAISSGIIPVMIGIFKYCLTILKKIDHTLSPAILFSSPQYIKSYLDFMNSVVKTNNSLVISWLKASNTNITSLSRTVHKLHSKTNIIDMRFVKLIDKYLTVNTTINNEQPFEPKIIFKPIKTCQVKVNEKMEVSSDTKGNFKSSLWPNVIQSYSSDLGGSSQDVNPIRCITESVSIVLSGTYDDIPRYIDSLKKLLKDPKTHSETLKALNKADFKLMPLLKLIFRSADQNTFQTGMNLFRYLFKSYPHIEKSTLWKMVYNISLAQGSTISKFSTDNMDYFDDEPNSHHQPPSNSSTMIKSLTKSIIQESSFEETINMGPKIDQLTLFGLGNILNDDFYDTIHKLLFSTHSRNHYAGYFMSDLLHQSNMFCLREILHSLLRKKSVGNLNAPRVLDFITTCLHHPRLQFSVVLPSCSKNLWPQQNLEIDITESELLNLLNLIVIEAEFLTEQHGANAKCVSGTLIKRCRLVEVCSSHRTLFHNRYRIINSYLENKIHNPTLEKLALALYSEIPNLISNTIFPSTEVANHSFHDNSTTNFLQTTADIISDSDCFKMKDFRRIGARLLDGLISQRHDLQDLAIQACKALVTKHPRLCVQLLPHMCALSDGAWDDGDSWADFRKKRGLVLYSNLLHLLEIMVPYSISSNRSVRLYINMMMYNFMRILIRYRDEHKFFANFVWRLVAFMERMIPLYDFCESNFLDNNNRFFVNHAAEIMALSKIYLPFKSLVLHSSKYINNNISNLPINIGNVNSSNIESDENRMCQMPLLKLDLLMKFRNHIQDTPNGHGILLQIKDLDEVSRCDSNMIGLFLDDLRWLLSHPVTEVRVASVKILSRYLNSFPEQVTHLIENCIIPNLVKCTSFKSMPFTNLTLRALCQMGMLAPDIVPTCLSHFSKLYVCGQNGRGNFRESIELLEVITDNITLESFMDTYAGDGNVTKSPVKKEQPQIIGHKRHFQDSDLELKSKRPRIK